MLAPEFRQLGAEQTALLAALLPECVAVAEQRGKFTGDLLTEEQAALGPAVAKRQIEFAAGRRCAREALHKLGVPPFPILRGSRREPLWPDGIVGSITHCEGYCGAAATFADQFTSLGIDAEPDEPLPEGVLPMIARSEEIRNLHQHPASRRCNIDRLLYSAKESTYKAWYPLAKSWLAFDAARIEFAADGQSFAVVLVGQLPAAVAGVHFGGRYLLRGGLILTAVMAQGRGRSCTFRAWKCAAGPEPGGPSTSF